MSDSLEPLRLLEEVLEEERKAFQAAQDEFGEKLASARQTLRSCAGNVEKNRANLERIAESSRAQMAAIEALLLQGGDSSALESELSAARGLLGAREAECAELLVKLAEREARVVVLEGEVGEALARVGVLEGEAAAAASGGTELSARVEALVASEARLMEEVSGLEARVGAAMESEVESQKLITTLRGEVAQARARLAEAEGALEGVEQSNLPLKAELERLRPQLESLLEGQGAAQAEVVALQGRLAALDGEKGNLLEDIEALRVENDRLQATVSTMITEAEANDLRRALDEERVRVDLLEQRLSDENAKGTKASLALQLAEAIKEAEEAKEALRQLRSSSGVRVSGGGVVAPKAAVESISRTGLEEQRMVLAAAKSAKGQKRTIGELLVEAGIVSRDQLQDAVEEQRRNPQTHLGAIFIERKHATEEAVAQALACQCGADFVDLGGDMIDAGAAALINERLANQHVCIPVRVGEEKLVVAMANPMDLVAIEDVERATGRGVEVVVGTPTQIREAIAKFYWEP